LSNPYCEALGIRVPALEAVRDHPPSAPRAVVLVDVGAREITTHAAEELPRAREQLNDYDVIAAVGVRPLLRALGYDPGPRRLAELGPPQKAAACPRPTAHPETPSRPRRRTLP
jgi:hypothetical protein